MAAKPLKKQHSLNDSYQHFDKLDGSHPWMNIVPDGYVPYRVRELGQGEIAYFNYPLAKEMGLIPLDHPHSMTAALKKKLLETFSIQIINEYDELYNKKIDAKTIKPKKYMASRYLQLQHTNRQGKTSGDGRGIWNGTFQLKGKVWDVSSRGTGVTCLAPGAVEANRPLKTGAGEFGYGCGLAEIDELYGAAILADIMHLQGIPTERVLCVIDLGKGYGIGVRAAQNLIRPAHLFLYLKQNRLKDLKNATDYLIHRQIQNQKWNIKSQRSPQKYDEAAEIICKSFADFTAKLDIDYIFAWLDWDGDNVLADAGIIDYGSVRQFGTRHDRYRYDDVERFSTNLNEQRMKAKQIVQVFLQMFDYIKTGKKKPIKNFAKHPTLEKFNQHFATSRAHRMLYRMGFNEIQRTNILKDKGLFEMFDREFSYFERTKISGDIQRVPDGVNHPALFNMRSALKILPEAIVKSGLENTKLKENDFFEAILSSFAKSKDAKMRTKHLRHIQSFQRLYKLLVKAAANKQKPEMIMPGILERARKLNTEDRITGNALIQIVFEIMAQNKKGMPHSDIQKIIDQLIYNQIGIPEVDADRFHDRKPRLISHADIYGKLMNLVAEYKDDI
jgi:uncharacterized protein YdiU (UPF0061 family)